MPNIGEKIKGREIGKQATRWFIWQACLGCGKEKWVAFINGKPEALRCLPCSHRFIREGKASKHIEGEGYVMVKLLPSDYFFLPMANRNGYVLEHRLVMAKHLGRNLHCWEIVHHKGIRYKGIENRSDNLLNNLQLISDDRHKQITILENRIKLLEKRVTWLETENVLLRGIANEQTNIKNI